MHHRTIVFAVLVLSSLASAEVLSSGGCNNALFVPGPYNGQVVFGDTSNAPTYSNVCNLDSYSGTYFYTITPYANSPMNITTCYGDTTFDTVLAVYQGEDCDSLRCVTSNNDDSCESGSTIQFTPTGGSYWVMVAGIGNSEGQFELSFMQQTTASYSCGSAVTIHGPFTTPMSIFDSISGNFTNAMQPCNVDSSVLGNWYIIYPMQGTLVTVTTCGDYADFDTALAVLAGDDCDNLECVSSNDDNCSTYAELSTVTFTADVSYYYIYVTGSGSAYGSYYLTISEQVNHAPPPPSGKPGMNCQSAYPIPGPGQYEGFTNFGGEPIDGSACGVSIDGCPAAWFVVSAPMGTTVTFSTCEQSTRFDTELLSLSGCSLSSCEAQNDDSHCHNYALASTITARSTGEDMYFAVYGFNCSVGQFGFSVKFS